MSPRTLSSFINHIFANPISAAARAQLVTGRRRCVAWVSVSTRQAVQSRVSEGAGDFAEYLRQETTGGKVLLLATAVALLWANVAGDSYHAVWETRDRARPGAGCIWI